MSYSYIYELQGASFSSLNAMDFKVAVVDEDDTAMTHANIAALGAAGKTTYAYVSVGEAEDYRDYWVNNHWDTNPPSYLLGENPDWPGNYNVKFWDTSWQQLMIARVNSMATLGYQGTYLDIIDAYQVPSVIAAYNASGHAGTIRQAMEDFVVTLSQNAKAINPNFKIIPQNAVELLSTNVLNDLGDTLHANTRYLNAIDGVGKEDTFTVDNEYPQDYTPYDQRYLQVALANGKFVLAIDYPTQASLQQSVLSSMLSAGYIPFIGDRDLDGAIPSINLQIPSQLSADVLSHAQVTSGSTGSDVVYDGTDANDVVAGGAGNDVLHGAGGNDNLSGGEGTDYIYGGDGRDSLSGGGGNDYLAGDVGNDTLKGDAGNDILAAADGDNSLSGGDGNDDLTAGSGNDTLFGDAGNDRLYGGGANDTLSGGAGDDTLSGDDGNDVMDGGDGNDRLYGGAGDDSMTGGAGNDWFFAGDGNDTLRGGDGNDVMFGGDGINSINGDVGNDFLAGGANSDVLIGGVGNDTLLGGGGADQFVYTIATGADSIRDFVHGTDHIELVGFSSGFSLVATFANVVAPHLVYANGAADITFSTGNSLHLDHITAGSLTSADFIFTG